MCTVSIGTSQMNAGPIAFRSFAKVALAAVPTGRWYSSGRGGKRSAATPTVAGSASNDPVASTPCQSSLVRSFAVERRLNSRVNRRIRNSRTSLHAKAIHPPNQPFQVILVSVLSAMDSPPCNVRKDMAYSVSCAAFCSPIFLLSRKWEFQESVKMRFEQPNVGGSSVVIFRHFFRALLSKTIYKSIR